MNIGDADRESTARSNYSPALVTDKQQSVVRILLYEDMIRDVQLMRNALKKAALPHQLTHVDKLSVLKSSLQSQRFDVVISDFHLPDTTVHEVLSLTHQLMPELPFIVVSGIALDEEVVDLLKSGAKDFVNKNNLARLAPAIIREVSEAEKRRSGLDAKQRLQLNERLLTDVMAASEDAVLLLENGRISDCNNATIKMFQVKNKQSLIGMDPLQCTPEIQSDGISSLVKWREKIAMAGEKYFCRFDWCFCRMGDKTSFPVQVTFTLTHREERQLLHMAIVDMTELRALQDAQAHIAEEERVLGEVLQLSFKHTELWEFLRAVLALLVAAPWLPLQQRGAIYLKDEESPSNLRLVGDYMLPAEIWEYSAAIICQAELCGKQCECCYMDGVAGEPSCHLPCISDEVLKNYHKFPFGCDGILGMLCLMLEEGAKLSTANLSFLSRFRNEISQVVQRVLAEQRSHYQATHDELTDLPNRRLLISWAESWWSQAQHLGKSRSVILLDVDKLKNINDSLGRSIGNLLLIAIGRRLNELLELGEFIAHLSGNLFCLVSAEHNDKRGLGGYDVQSLVERIQKGFSHPFVIEKHDLYVTLNMGIAMIPTQGQADDLLIQAEMALHSAKGIGRGCVKLYQAQMAVETLARHQLENDLRHALNDNELELYFQPQVAPDNGAIVGCESLLRWKHGVRGWISPAVFVPIAEESGLIYSMGEWVLREACRIAHSWRLSGVKCVPVAVNISALQFQQHDFVERVSVALRDSGLEPEMLELEVTETVAMDRAEHVIDAMHRLTDMGVRLAIDDFGTGYSSLSYLKAFPLHKLKIDREFVKDLGAGDDGSVARFIMQLAKGEKLRTVVEGVETEQQLRFFCELDCDLVQGFYYSRPLPAKEFIALLVEGFVTPSL